VTAVDELIAFVRSCVDEDERVAREAATTDPGPWRADYDERGYDGRIRDGRGYTVVHQEDSTPGRATAEHIAHWDPARVLAEVKAKRERLGWIEGELRDDSTNETAQWLARVEAKPYAGRQGWRKEWRA
jgi:hypothetical protein